MGPLALSVIVPVRDGARFLPESLGALAASDLPRGLWELIVVDDWSTDLSAVIAHQYAEQVIRVAKGPRGPAAARNSGAEVARGKVLMFVDADVSVHSDALRRTSEVLEREPDVAAVFGSYDSAPAAAGLVSQYRNLAHRYVHQREAGDAVTFWAGCGAVRADVFTRCGGFDETLKKASIEDIELGYRLSTQGHRIVLRPEIEARHLKRWTLRNMIVTDVQHRGIPWMRLLMRRRIRPSATLNVRVSEQVCTALVAAGWLASLAWLWTGAISWLAVSAAAVVSTLAINGPLIGWFGKHRGWRFAAAVIPLRLLYYTLNLISVGFALVSIGFEKSTRGHPGRKRGDQRVPSTGPA